MCRQVQDWDCELENHLMVDYLARMSLNNLAERSEAGHLEANSIIGKLLKKISEGKPADNPSAFVTVGCQKAMPDYR